MIKRQEEKIIKKVKEMIIFLY